jgi:hypothetical protein
MINSERSELASMYTEAMNQLDGLEIQSYVSTLMGSTGDEPQCLPTTHSSMYQLWSGDTTPDHVSSSTRYRWRELYVAWKLVTVLPNLPTTLDLPQKGTAVHSTNGLSELDAAFERRTCEYCKHDVYLCEEIFKRLGCCLPIQGVTTHRHDAEDVHTCCA